MTLFRLSIFVLIALVCAVGVAAFFKNRPAAPAKKMESQSVIEVELDPIALAAVPLQQQHAAAIASSAVDPRSPPTTAMDPPEGNRIQEFFSIKDPKLPIVETVTYRSRVAWQNGRPAWLSDYAAHYKTSRHFIARSLNGKPDYLKQEVAEGDQFNVLSLNKNFRFHLVVDTSRCKMWFYYIDLDSNRATLLATYRVGLGRIDSSQTSGLLTPLGCYSLGSKTATYKPASMGNYHGRSIAMITVFGTRWIPFDKEIAECSLPAKGFGIHGTPWVLNGGAAAESSESIGKYESDGCIRMLAHDIEELFAIVITKPTQIEIVKDFFDSTIAHSQE